MLVMTYSQARQNFSSFLDSAKENGMAFITRSDGSKFKVVPYESASDSPESIKESVSEDSPFAELATYSSTVNSKLKNISMQEIIDMMHEAQDERADRILAAASGKTAKDFFKSLEKCQKD